MRPEQIPYGVKDFREIREQGLYYVDKTAYIRELEARADFVFFVRPRRFGKTLLCETLRCYYDYAADPRIPQLAGGTLVHFIDLEFVGREMRVCEEVVF